MALVDPVAVYNAQNNVEAHLIQNLLADAGVEAFVIEDVSQVGTWMFGLLPEIHKPQIWIERIDAPRVKPILDDYESRLASREDAIDDRDAVSGPPMDAVCEKCGKHSSYPAGQKGSVQECPHCGEYVDVGDDERTVEWVEPSGDEEGDEEKTI